MSRLLLETIQATLGDPEISQTDRVYSRDDLVSDLYLHFHDHSGIPSRQEILDQARSLSVKASYLEKRPYSKLLADLENNFGTPLTESPLIAYLKEVVKDRFKTLLNGNQI